MVTTHRYCSSHTGTGGPRGRKRGAQRKRGGWRYAGQCTGRVRHGRRKRGGQRKRGDTSYDSDTGTDECSHSQLSSIVELYLFSPPVVRCTAIEPLQSIHCILITAIESLQPQHCNYKSYLVSMQICAKLNQTIQPSVCPD